MGVKLVGILNLTPDSFSDGGQFNTPGQAIRRFHELLAEGADFVDIGAESTRPGAQPLTADEEWQRLGPVAGKLIYPGADNVSIDTYHPETVAKAARLGDFIINDVSGFHNPEMIQAAAQYQLTCIVSHLPKASTGDIQSAHHSKKIDSIHQVLDELLEEQNQMIQMGVAASSIILDPGIGFGKTKKLNFQLLRFAELVENDVMVGYSRKKFLGEDHMTLIANLAAAHKAVRAGAKYLRVHDVAGHKYWLDKYGLDKDRDD